MLVYPARVEMPNGPFLANERTGMVSPIPDEILESWLFERTKMASQPLTTSLTGVGRDFDVEAPSMVSKNSGERNRMT